MERLRANLPAEIEALFGDTRSKCRACGLSELSYPVHPRGNWKAKVSMLFEAAGKNEELGDLVMNGPAATTFEKVAETTLVNLDRDFLIYNVALCRPHPPAGDKRENRAPTSAEVKACSSNVSTVIKAHKPQLIVAGGGIAAAALMRNYPGTVSSVVGRFFGPDENVFGIDADLYVIYHPSYILRNPTAEKDFAHQLIKLRDYMIANDLKIKEHQNDS
jgi:DNA polymerase